MTNWLSKIEKQLKGYGKYRASWPINVERKRMARMIRELAECLSTIKEDPGNIPNVNLLALCTAYVNLSPDAKEIVKCSDG